MLSSKKNETVSVILLVTAVFVVITVLVIALFKTQYETADLSLENRIERAFSKLLLAAQEGHDAVVRVMEDSEILGFGYYSVEGEPELIWGENIHTELPFSFFASTNVPYYKESNVVGYDEEDGTVECIRYYSPGASKQDFDTIPFSELADENTNYVIYMSIMGSDYIAAVQAIGVSTAFAMTIIAILYVIMLYVLLQNVKYRDKLREQESLVAMGQAARTLTHEIKNPLSAIKLQAALLKRTAPVDVQEDIEVITSESERLSRLSSKVAEFLKNPVGEAVQINLEEFVEDIIGITNRNIPFKSNVGKNEVPIIMFDSDRLRSVIENVVINAIQSKDGDVEGMEIELSNLKKEKSYALAIRDRGCGISASDIKKVFDPFYTTKVHGSGIGLSISKQFLKAAGGSIVIEPRKGGGTEVVLIFKKKA